MSLTTVSYSCVSDPGPADPGLADPGPADPGRSDQPPPHQRPHERHTPDDDLQTAARWLDAAPFRAHVEHVMAVGDLSAAALAVLAGVSARAVHHLLHGRGGRQVRKICPYVARRLFLVTPAEAGLVRFRKVPAARAQLHLAELRAAGWTVQRLADVLGATLTETRALLDGRAATCSQRVALRAAAAARCWRSEVALPTLPAPFAYAA